MAAVHTLSRSKGAASALDSITLFAAWTVGSLLLSLLLWVIIPTIVFGWRPLAVTSASMSPTIRSGDVVLVDPRFGQPGSGSVVAFNSEGSIAIHRVLTTNPDGSLTTKGDANSQRDSTPVSPRDLVGTGRLLVPFIGWTRVVGWGWFGSVLALGFVAAMLWRSRPGWSASIAVLGLATASVAVATAAFAASTANDGISVTTVDVAPPANLGATCGLVGAGDVEVDLAWTPSPSPGVTGYRVFHDDPTAGIDWVELGTTTAPDVDFTHLIPTQLVSIGTHSYMVRASLGSWDSEDSNVDAVTITQVVLAYVCTEL